MNERQEKFLVTAYRILGDTNRIVDARQVGKSAGFNEAESIDIFQQLKAMGKLDGTANGCFFGNGREDARQIIDRYLPGATNEEKVLVMLADVTAVSPAPNINALVTVPLGMTMDGVIEYIQLYSRNNLLNLNSMSIRITERLKDIATGIKAKRAPVKAKADDPPEQSVVQKMRHALWVGFKWPFAKVPSKLQDTIAVVLVLTLIYLIGNHYLHWNITITDAIKKQFAK